MAAAERLRPGDCPEAEFYGRNGYVTYPAGGVDRWWIEGDRLVRVVVEPMPGGTRAEIGQVLRQRFTRTRAGALLFRGADWRQRLVRCGHAPRD